MKYFKAGLLAFVSIIFSNISFSQAPTATENVMNFSSVSLYESFADDENTLPSLHSIAIQSGTLTTLAELQWLVEDNDTLHPDFLKEVLNTDYIFQIGSYLIKIDLYNNRGLVILSSNTDAYLSLQSNDLEATGMMVLNGDEEFGLELLEELEKNAVTSSNYDDFLKAARACGGADRRDDKQIEPWAETYEQCDGGGSSTNGITYGMDNKLAYQKAIFFFSLQSKIRSIKWCTFGGNPFTVPVYTYADLKLIGTVKYRKRCGTEVNQSENMLELAQEWGDGVLHWRAYSGGRSLSHFDFNVDFGIRIPNGNPNVPAFIPSRHYRIVYGY